MTSISSIGGASQAWSAMSANRAQRQEKMFAKVDTDGNGSVNQAELDTLLKDLDKKMGMKSGDSKELFSKMDSNSDGSLSRDELDEGMKKLMQPPPSTVNFAQSRQARDRADEMFKKLDGNSDGSLDAEEVKAFADKVKADTGFDLSDKLKELDTDGDGALSKSEFKARNTEQPIDVSGEQTPVFATGGAGGPVSVGRASSTDDKDKSYDPLDLNRDGTVTELEKLAGALKELSQSDQNNGTGGSGQSEVAKLAQKLYEQISANLKNPGNNINQSVVDALA